MSLSASHFEQNTEAVIIGENDWRLLVALLLSTSVSRPLCHFAVSGEGSW